MSMVKKNGLLYLGLVFYRFRMAIYISLGSNIGDTHGHLARARTLLQEAGLQIARASAEIRTKAWGMESQSDFLNQVLRVDFAPDFTEKKDHYTLLYICQKVEKEIGKTMSYDEGYIKWGPRVIDIDILKYDEIVSDDPTLILPHHTVAKDYIKKLLAEVG